MVLKVKPISLNDRIEYLMLKKRFDETLLLISQQKDPLAVDIETILKVENGYLQHIMKLKDYDKLAEILPKFV